MLTPRHLGVPPRGPTIASAEEVQSAVRRLAARSAALGERYPLVLAVMGGAVVFAGQILPLLRFPLDFDYVHASRYGAGTRGRMEWRVRPPDLVKGRTVLVLDDILDHGETMSAIRKGLTRLARRACTRRAGGEEPAHQEADDRRLRRPAHSRPLRVRLRHGRQAMAQSPEIRAMKAIAVLAIIGGSGLTKLANLEIGRRKVARTPYGDPSGPITFGRIGRAKCCFSRAMATAHHRAARGELPREPLGAQAGRRGRGGVGRLGGRHPQRHLARHAAASAPDHRLHLGPLRHLLRGTGGTGQPHRFHRAVFEAMRERLLRRRRRGRAHHGRRRTPRRRGRGSRPPPRSTGSNATAPTRSA